MRRTPFLLALAGALLLTAGCTKAADTSSSVTTTTTTGSTTTTSTTAAGSGTSTPTSAGSGSSKSFMDQLALADLPSSVTTCITDKEDNDASFKAIVESKADPSMDQAKQVMPTILSCMSKEQFAKVVLAGSRTPVSEAGAACMTQLIESMSTDDLAGMSANDRATSERFGPQLMACAGA
jgi:hypothetical protein